jgi:hypothetical protein
MSSPSPASPQSRAALGLPPEPWLVRWYFESRLLADFSIGYTRDQLAASDRLWAYICEHDGPPPADWLAANNAEANPSEPERLGPVKPAEAVAQFRDETGTAEAGSSVTEEPVEKPERSSRAAYWREHKRRQRASQPRRSA